MATAKLFPFWKLKPPAYVCPSGEQIVNGDFETGNATGWTLTDGNVQSSIVHSGVYAARVYPSGPRLLEQDLATPLRVECIASFGAWTRTGSGNVATATVVYDDDTYVTYILVADGTWHYTDLLAGLEAGKTVAKVRFNNGYVTHLYVDDVSLIGTG